MANHSANLPFVSFHAEFYKEMCFCFVNMFAKRPNRIFITTVNDLHKRNLNYLAKNERQKVSYN